MMKKNRPVWLFDSVFSLPCMVASAYDHDNTSNMK